MTFTRSSIWGMAGAAWSAALVVGALAPVDAQRRLEPSERAPVTARLVAERPEDGYVGEGRCQSCHKAEATEFHKTPHAGVIGAGSTQIMDCESCHGPGKAHADAVAAARGDDAAIAAATKLIFSFKGSAQDNASRCLTCHVTSSAQRSFGHSEHLTANVDCQSCHSTHLVERASPAVRLAQAEFFSVPALDVERRWLRESLLKESQPELCYTCHAGVRAQFSQPFHHRVPEGSMKCTDCHSAHGTENHASLTSPDWATCTKCHADKHGPFLFEHAAVRVEGCAVCHSPHGGTARFMLNRRESRFLCLQCHGDPHNDLAQVSVPHSRLGFQTRGDCVRCHVAVHGSNFNKELLE